MSCTDSSFYFTSPEIICNGIAIFYLLCSECNDDIKLNQYLLLWHQSVKSSLFNILQAQKTSVGIKPCIVVSGEFFEDNDDNKRVKNLFIGIIFFVHYHHYVPCQMM